MNSFQNGRRFANHLHGQRVLLRALLACWLVVSSGLPLLPSTAQASAARVTTPPPITPCAANALMSTWQGVATFSYDGTRTVDNESAHVRRSAEIAVTLGSRQAGAIGDPTVYWSVVGASGTALADDGHTWNDGTPHSETLKFDGAVSQVMGSLQLNTANCTYRLELQTHFLGVYESSDGGGASQPGWNAFLTAPRAADAQGVLQGNAAAALTFEADYSQDQAGLDDGAIPSALRSLAMQQGAPDAGAATVTWKLQASTVLPHITGVRFEQQRVPSGEWVALPANRTTDGNLVKITVDVENPTDVLLATTIRLLEAETMTPLPNGIFKAPLAGGMTHHVELTWDTQGWTWYDPQCPECYAAAHPNHRILVQLITQEWLFDDHEETVTVKPKPVVLVHGMSSNADTWAAYPGLLQARHPLWAAFPAPNLKTGNDLINAQASNTVMQNARELNAYIETTRAAEQAWHVDLVAHSMGGLISRQYIQRFMPDAPVADERPLAAHLLMLGTPNRGSICAKALTLVHWLADNPNLNAPMDLIPEVVAGFNQRVTEQRGVSFAVLAGWLYTYPCDPLNPTPSDIVVTVESAKYIYSDTEDTTSLHTAMTSSGGDFASFVLPRLTVGRADLAPFAASASATPATIAPASAPAAGSDMQIAQLIDESVPAGAVRDFAIDVPAVSALGISAVAAPAIALALVDPDGAVAASSAANDDAAHEPIRALSVASPAPGAWRLRVTNTGAQAADVAAGVLLAGDALAARITFGAAQGATTPVEIALTRAGVPQPGAALTALVINGDGSQQALALRDDGLQGDRVAGDGIYTGAVTQVGEGLPVVLVRAEQAGQMRAALAVPGAPEGQEGAQSRLFLPVVTR